jgi:thiamine biosynthesis lipoprotein
VVALGVVFQLSGGCIRAAAPSRVGPLAAARPASSETDSAPELVSDGRYRMGTVLELTLVAGQRQAADAPQALEQAFGKVAELDGLLSRFDRDSDVSRLNASAGQGLQAVDPRTRELLDFCRRAATLTQGGFDVTVGPLVELWTAAAERGRVPDEQELTDALRRVGADRILLDPAGRVGLGAAGMSVDLGGVAKGFALDVAVAELREAGFDRGLLSFGRSSIWGLGRPPDAAGWRLLLESPSHGYSGVVELADRALSVSSSLGQWSEIGGRRYGHVVDPRTGRPTGRGKQAVVVARSAALAEVLSTALLVLPEAVGMAIVEGQEAEARVVDEQGRAQQSSGWQQATHFEPLEPVAADAGEGATAASPAGLRSGA